MNLLMNILWLLLGGIFTAVEYLIASFLMMITIIGIPFGLQTLKMALLALYPFGKEVRSCPDSGGCLSILMNILWIFLPFTSPIRSVAEYHNYRIAFRYTTL